MGLVANTPEITRAWSAFETSLRGMTTTVDLPIYSDMSARFASLWLKRDRS